MSSRADGGRFAWASSRALEPTACACVVWRQSPARLCRPARDGERRYRTCVFRGTGASPTWKTRERETFCARLGVETPALVSVPASGYWLCHPPILPETVVGVSSMAERCFLGGKRPCYAKPDSGCRFCEKRAGSKNIRPCLHKDHPYRSQGGTRRACCRCGGSLCRYPRGTHILHGGVA